MRLPGQKHRRLLASLVVHAGRTVASDVLIETLWDGRPPSSAAKLVQVYVSQLRKALPGALGIATCDRGYALVLDPRSLDAARFERLLADGTPARRNGNPEFAFSVLGVRCRSRPPDLSPPPAARTRRP